MSLLDEIRKRFTRQSATPAAPDAAALQRQTEATLQAASGKEAQAGTTTAAASSIAAQTMGQQAQSAAAATDLRAAGTAAQLGAAEQAQQAEFGLGRERIATGLEQAAAERAAAVQGAAAERQTTAALGGMRTTAASTMQAQRLAAKSEEVLAALAADRKSSLADIFTTFREGTAELALRKDAAELEQAAFVSALADKKYVETLQQIGEERRLGDKQNFIREVEDTTLDAGVQDLMNQLQWQSLYNVDARAFDEAMAALDFDAAMAVAGSQAKSTAAGYATKGLGELAQVGAKASKSDKPAPEAPSNTTGVAARQTPGGGYVP